MLSDLESGNSFEVSPPLSEGYSIECDKKVDKNSSHSQSRANHKPEFFYQTVQTCANQDGWVAGPWGVVWVTGGVSGWRLRGNGPSGDDRHALVARTRQNLDHGVVGLRVERLGEPKRTHQTTRTSRANGVFWPCGSRDIRGHFSVSAVERPNASERGQSPRASGIARTRGRHLLDVTQISSRLAGHAPSHRSLSHLSRTVVFRSHPPARRPPHIYILVRCLVVWR